MRALSFIKQKLLVVEQPRFHETCNFGFNSKILSVMAVFN